MFKSFIRNFSILCRKIKFLFKKRKIDKSITIISNNCTGGTMYNDLNLKFLSPTINLYFEPDGSFYFFCKNLKEYITEGELIFSSQQEPKQDFKNSPIGVLKCNGLPNVIIHFLHYSSFEEARAKWFSRSKRINFHNIHLVIEAQSLYEKEMINKYLTLPYNKTIFTDTIIGNSACVKMSFYDKIGKGDKYPILKLINIFGKRGYDEYDFVNQIFRRNKI